MRRGTVGGGGHREAGEKRSGLRVGVPREIRVVIGAQAKLMISYNGEWAT